jgi:carbonic anhydrase
MFEIAEGAASKGLTAIKAAYPDTTKIKLDLSEFLNNDAPLDFWYYLGSATIPPCKNGVLEWIISKRVFQMS